MASLRSESRYTEPGTYESFTGGPGGGEFDMGPGGGGPGDMMEMFQAMFEEGMEGKKQARRQAGERHGWAKRAERRKYAPKLASAKKAGPMDPMRYINQQRQAARHAQGARGGYTGIGEMTMKQEGEKAAEQAASMYPLYAQAMMMG